MRWRGVNGVDDMSYTLFQNMTLIDGNGNEPVQNASMLIENGIIREIGHVKADSVNYDKVLDFTGKYVVPGIIDCHVHAGLDSGLNSIDRASMASEAETTINYISNMNKLLSDGVVFFREMGTKYNVDVAVAQAVSKGDIIGPGIIPCGTLITITGGHCWRIGTECDGSDDIVKAVRAQIKAGAQVIKIMATGGLHTQRTSPNVSQFNLAELIAGIKEAHKFGLKAGAHCMNGTAARLLLEAGIDSIEHGCFLCDDEEVFDIMVKKGVYYVPTLYAIQVLANDDPAFGLSKELLSKSIPCHKKHIKSFQIALKKGVKIAFGTDRGTNYNHFQSGSVELPIMNSLGMSANDIIVSFSKTASELLGIDKEYGTLESGKRANFLVLDKNPLDNICILTGTKQVYLNGIMRF